MNRISEIIFILIFFIPIAILSVLVCVLIIVFDRSPIFYKQIRVGKNWKKFKIYKFRTMKVNRSKGMDFSGKNITVIGKLLRKLKLDELPQIINIIKNDMALVGPRPEIPSNFLIKHKKKWNKILRIKPGVTDFASIKFRNEEIMLKRTMNPKKLYINKILPKKLSLNEKYVDNRSLYLDINIILKTFTTVIFK